MGSSPISFLNPEKIPFDKQLLEWITRKKCEEGIALYGKGPIFASRNQNMAHSSRG